MTRSECNNNAQKYLKLFIITRNKELIKLFAKKNLDIMFQDILNLKLSLLEEIKVDSLNCEQCPGIIINKLRVFL